MLYGEMDIGLKDAVVLGFTRRFAVNQETARTYLDNHPEFSTDSIRGMECGDKTWTGILREMLWGGDRDE